MVKHRKSVGIIINPLAGLGGRVGLKGSDGADTVNKALELGGKPESPLRASKAIEKLIPINDKIKFYTYGGTMGEDILKGLNIEYTVVGHSKSERTNYKDSIEAANIMKGLGVDLIILAGGDGTARNICEAVGLDVLVLGIPSGVKMHSAVYAINPKNAGIVDREYIEEKITGLAESEVMDIDEDLFRERRVSAKLYGYMNVPVSTNRIQNMKSGGGSEEADLDGMAGYIIAQMKPDIYYIVGPGSTTRSIMDIMELPSTLLGVDIIKDGKLLYSDVTERQIWNIIENPKLEVKIIVTIIGGQGSVFGRGN